MRRVKITNHGIYIGILQDVSGGACKFSRSIGVFALSKMNLWRFMGFHSMSIKDKYVFFLAIMELESTL